MVPFFAPRIVAGCARTAERNREGKFSLPEWSFFLSKSENIFYFLVFALVPMGIALKSTQPTTCMQCVVYRIYSIPTEHTTIGGWADKSKLKILQNYGHQMGSFSTINFSPLLWNSTLALTFTVSVAWKDLLE